MVLLFVLITNALLIIIFFFWWGCALEMIWSNFRLKTASFYLEFMKATISNGCYFCANARIPLIKMHSHVHFNILLSV
jgi:hypothetical protein